MNITGWVSNIGVNTGDMFSCTFSHANTSHTMTLELTVFYVST